VVSGGLQETGDDHPPLRYGETTYTKDQVERLVGEQHARLDGAIAQITKERDALKAAHQTVASQLVELQRRIDEADVEELKNNPDELDMYQRRKDLREEQTALKAEKDALERDRAAHAERLQKATELEWDAAVGEAAATVKGDAARLKAKAAQYGITDPEKLRGLAADLWPSGVHADSGQTNGGGTDLNKLPAREQIARGLLAKH
jgi:uncharacterized protein involved in exopolysaccharide biosynthesis